MRSSSNARGTGNRLLVVAIAASCILSQLALASPVAAASPPAPPVLVAPGDGAVAADNDPVLRVGLANPEGTPLTVTFEGRKKGATEPGTAEGEPFTLVAVPDIQNYTSASRAHYITDQTEWIVDTRSTLNTQFVVQLGDLVSDWAWPGHWPFASDGLKVLDDNGVPNAVVAGNHDFDNATGAHAEYDAWFPPSRYANAQWTPSTARYGGYMGQDQFGDDPVDRANMNNYSLFTAGGVDWLVLGLEWEAPTPALEWADRVLAAFPDREVIVFTHAFLNLPGTRRTFAQRPGGTPPETIWQNFVRTHCQIRLVLNGHEHNGDLGEARRTDPNACGEPVHQILTDYQARANGGNGWMRYYRFDPAAETMTAVTYSPVLDQYETDADSAFTLPFAFAEPQPAGFTPIATLTTSGNEATATWTGLARDTEYEWRVRVSDGTTTTTSSVWSLKTRPDDVLFTDGFARTLTNTWGTADSGQAWTSAAPANAFSVDGSAGRMIVPAGQRRNVAPANTTVTEASLLTSIAATPAITGGGIYATLYARLGTVGDYRATVQFRSAGAPNLIIVRRVGSTETNLATYRLPVAPGVGEAVNLRFELAGTSPTVLRARAWLGPIEPTAWQVTAIDSTGPQTAGGIGFTNYVSGTATSPATLIIDRLIATRIGAAPPPPPPNSPPAASIQVTSQSERTVNVSGTGSTDTDGTITGYAWNFGDGTTATGPTATRTYTADGTYTVTLTVTDDDGATHSTTKSVTVAATPPPPGSAIASDAFSRTVTSGWGTADVGGAWSVSGAASMYSVGSGLARQSLATKGASAVATLASVNSRDGVLKVDVSWNRHPTQGAIYASASPRSVNATNDYRCSVYIGSSGKPKIDVIRRVNGVETSLGYVSLASVPFTVDTEYTLLCRAQTVAGGTQIAAKFFSAGSAEPAAWQVSATDSTAALQANGRVLLWSYLSSSASTPIVTSWDDLSLTPIAP
jgi:PKD repeat protein